MALPTTRNDALNSVIGLAELLQAKPLFIDPLEHDSLMAAASHLPMLAGATLWKVVGRSPAWPDIQQIAHSSFAGATEALGASSETLADAILDNREYLLGWLDRFLIALHESRDTLAAGDRATLVAELDEATSGYTAWTDKTSEPPEQREARARAETQTAINDARPSRNLLGSYISDRIFGKKDKR
jgi:prephenate dehydrogenase